MSLVSWPIVDIIDSVDDKLFAFDTLFNDILEQHAPVKSFKIRGKQNPCVTDNIRGLMKIRENGTKKQRKQTILWHGGHISSLDKRLNERSE